MTAIEHNTARIKPEQYTATRNACRLCAPLGASLAFRGVQGAVPFLHGSQGCSTYIRRYMISHFREPMDIACSNFGEATAIFGGKENLRVGLVNVARQYQPEMIGIATTCLAETIGDDVKMFLQQIRQEVVDVELPALVCVATPSYTGSHAEGFHAAVHALVDALAKDGPASQHVNLMPGMRSPGDIRFLKEIFEDFEVPPIIVPDYSDTLDGPIWSEYQQIPPGGTPLEALRQTATARATIEFGGQWRGQSSAGSLLEERYGVRRHSLPVPIGVGLSDRFFTLLETIAGHPIPDKHTAERGRLIDSMIDAHKYVFGKRAVVYGEPDLVIGMAALLSEIGVVPALCASGTMTGSLRESIAEVTPNIMSDITVLEDVDFSEIEEHAAQQKIDLIVGNSKGFKLSNRLGVPLIRVGFPIHDRIGGARLLHVGYRGTQQLFDRIANAIIEAKQNSSSVGYTYM